MFDTDIQTRGFINNGFVEGYVRENASADLVFLFVMVFYYS